MRILFPLAVAALLLTAPLAAQAQSTTAAVAPTATPAQRKAAEELLITMQAEKSFTVAIDQMLTMQVQQRPEVKQVEPEMRAFMAKYMSWASLKEDMISLYTKEFTEKELKEMTKFYATPTGQKFVTKQSYLMQAGMELGQRRVQENLPELQRTIQAKMKSTEQ